MTRIAIVGAGAMGCLFAARLAEAGENVCLIDVDAVRLAVLQSEGIRLHDDRGERTVTISAGLARSVTGPFDLVMLLTKGMHSAAAIESVAHLSDGECWALTLQNGIGNAEAIARVFPPSRVLVGVTDFPADLLGSNHVSSQGPGGIFLGSLTPEADVGAAQAVELFRNAGMDARVHGEIRVPVWEKLAFNAALNSLATVSGLTVGEMNVDAGRRIIESVIAEVVETAHAVDIKVDRARIAAKVQSALDHHGNHQPSMLQDRLARRRSEIETINGEVVRVALAAGVRTPVTATLADLVRMTEPGGDARVPHRP